MVVGSIPIDGVEFYFQFYFLPLDNHINQTRFHGSLLKEIII